MLQYISYLQLCSNVLQNKLSRRQQKYIVNVYKTVQHGTLLHGYWLCSVSSYVLRKRNKMPKIKGKKYTNHLDLTPLKTPSVSPGSAPLRPAGSPRSEQRPPSPPGPRPHARAPAGQLPPALWPEVTVRWTPWFCLLALIRTEQRISNAPVLPLLTSLCCGQEGGQVSVFRDGSSGVCAARLLIPPGLPGAAAGGLVPRRERDATCLPDLRSGEALGSLPAQWTRRSLRCGGSGAARHKLVRTCRSVSCGLLPCVTPATARSHRSRRPWARRRRAPRSRTATCAPRGPAPAPSAATPSSAPR